MNKVLVSVAIVALSIQSYAQSSSTATPAAPAATSATSTETVTPAPVKKWSGGVMLIVDRDAIKKDTNIQGYDAEGSPITSDNFDIDGSEMSTQTHISVGYKRDNGHSVKLVQRLFYSTALLSSRQSFQSNWDFGTLRATYTVPGKAMGGSGALTIRTSLPTTQAAIDSSFLGQVALIPSLSWEINPKWSISYSGFAAATLYHGKNNSGFTDYDRDQVALKLDSYAGMLARRGKSGAERSFFTVSNSFALNYAISDAWSVSQSVGQNFGARNTNFLKRFTQGWDLSTSVGWSPAANVNFELGVSQGIADMPGAMNPVLEKPLYFDNYNFALFRPEQTSYSFVTSVTF